jgi:hypothetical protein
MTVWPHVIAHENVMVEEEARIVCHSSVSGAAENSIWRSADAIRRTAFKIRGKA